MQTMVTERMMGMEKIHETNDQLPENPLMEAFIEAITPEFIEELLSGEYYL